MDTKVSVLGSVNMDLVARVNRFPRPGETLKGTDFDRVPGGKGANQAVAASRLGGDVSFFGLVGQDGFGQELLENLNENGVDTESMQTRDCSTGLAMIQVDNSGENQIVIIPGANGKVDEEYVDSYIEAILDTDVLLLQLEIPFKTTSYLLDRLNEAEGSSPVVILDPAPARELSELTLSAVDYLIPNREEAEQLIAGEERRNLESEILNRGVRGLVITKGEEGSSFISREERFEVPGFSVEVADTTGAGDAFAGAFAVEQSRENNMRRCLEFANATGAIAASRDGAQPSLPRRNQVINLSDKLS
ncbi:MAG: ribokinase [Candidatus Bipolaricaulota bacterium]|nr:ribokinase [Candidatus Bipolaricaulota bacterium]MBS3791665.1 ribokinase [Candidatus Bipolaricaulota bacterium]